MAPPDADTDALEALLSGLGVVRCQMHHETIRREADGVTPVAAPGIPHGLARARYCAAARRRRHLGCAHTLARARLDDALARVGHGLGLPTAGWREELGQLDLAILAVDRKKSDAELAHAQRSAVVCTLPDPRADRELAAIADHIARLDAEHTGYVDRLAALRDEILTALRDRVAVGGPR